MGNSTTCKIVTPENFTLQLSTCDDVGEVTRHANFVFYRYSGVFAQIGEILPPCAFLTVLPPYLFSRCYGQVDPLYRFSRFMAQTTCFSAIWLFWGLEQWASTFGGYMPQNSPKIGVNRQFQAKTAKCNSAADRPSKSKPEIEFQYGGHPFSETGSSFIWALDWAVANGSISKTRGRRSVLCGETLNEAT